LGSLWYYQDPSQAPDVEKCTAGVQLEAGIVDAKWLDSNKVIVGLDTGKSNYINVHFCNLTKTKPLFTRFKLI